MRKENSVIDKRDVFKRPPPTFSRGQSVPRRFACRKSCRVSVISTLFRQPSRGTFTRVMAKLGFLWRHAPNRIHLPLFRQQRRVVPISRHARNSFASRLERAAAMLTRIRFHLQTEQQRFSIFLSLLSLPFTFSPVSFFSSRHAYFPRENSIAEVTESFFDEQGGLNGIDTINETLSYVLSPRNLLMESL